jgi:hypothetical protein
MARKPKRGRAVLRFSDGTSEPLTADIAYRLLEHAAGLLNDPQFAELGRKNLHDVAATMTGRAVEKLRRTVANTAVSDADIIAALRAEPTQQDAAAKLGITDKQIRNRVAQKLRHAIRNKK